MAVNNDLSPEIVRALSYGSGIKDLIGKWISFGNAFKGKRLIINIATIIRDGSAVVGFVAFNRSGMSTFLEGHDVDDADILIGKILIFDPASNKGSIELDKDRRILPFSFADQSETPQAIKNELRVLTQYPVGDVIDVPAWISNGALARFRSQELLISGYTLSLAPPGPSTPSPRCLGMLELLESGSAGQNSISVPVAFFEMAGLKPNPRPTAPLGRSASHRMDA